MAGLRVTDPHSAVAASRGQPCPVSTEYHRVSPPPALAGCDALAGPGVINGNVITRATHRDQAAVRRKRQRENRTILCLERAEGVRMQVVEIQNTLGAFNYDEIAGGVAGNRGQPPCGVLMFSRNAPVVASFTWAIPSRPTETTRLPSTLKAVPSTQFS